MRAFTAVLAFLCLIVPGFAPGAQAAPKFPALTGRVVDDANILSDSVKQDLTGKLAALEAKTSRQLVVVTVPSLQGYEISDFGYQLGRAWGIGQGKLNNGVLFIIAPKEHRTRIEVGYGLEPIRPTRCHRSSSRPRSCLPSVTAITTPAQRPGSMP